MNLDLARLLLIWCVGINYLVITLWFLVFAFAHDWLYRTHTRWFKLSVEAFDLANYLGMAIYKIGVLLLLVTPLVALFFIP
jgi:hypothetical protein